MTKFIAFIALLAAFSANASEVLLQCETKATKVERRTRDGAALPPFTNPNYVHVGSDNNFSLVLNEQKSTITTNGRLTQHADYSTTAINSDQHYPSDKGMTHDQYFSLNRLSGDLIIQSIDPDLKDQTEVNVIFQGTCKLAKPKF